VTGNVGYLVGECGDEPMRYKDVGRWWFKWFVLYEGVFGEIHFLFL
jgi:hypothetical protein